MLRERIGAQLGSAAETPHTCWIWVHHAPPADSPVSWDGRRSCGNAALSQWIMAHRPDIVVSGHVHTAPFVQGGSWADRIGETWVFNMGQQIGTSPAHIVFDLDRQAALWFSIYGNEELSLNAPLHRPITRLPKVPDWLAP